MPEVFIEGRGLAGYNLANKLAEKGTDVLVGGKHYNEPRSWFVLTERLPSDVQTKIRTKEIPSYALDACRFIIFDPATERVDYDFTSKTSGELEQFDCVMIDDQKMKADFRDAALAQPSVSVIDSSVQEVKQKGSGYEVVFESGQVEEVSKVVDASGSGSKLLRSLHENPLRDDAIVYWIYGWRVHGRFDGKTMVFPLKDISTGRMPWISPWSDTTADILAADYCRVSDWKKLLDNGTFQETYERFRDMCVRNGICEVDTEVERIYGRTRLVPLGDAYGTDGVFAVGDAAGQACPNMAEGVPPALLNSDYLAEQLNANPAYTGEDYYHDWRHGRQRIQPFELSTSFLLGRYPLEKAGMNAKLYKAIAENGDITKMMRLMRNRSLSIADAPDLIKVGIKDPAVLARFVNTLIRSRFAFHLPKYREVLYGEDR